ncbi:radical SAM/SPASM domain protein, ACGX system [Methanobrevibacter sp.]|uniref:radical SAM/SPASM domain protein, ACGX system n=1 Tax=Methanobrevibacter sp. TaxID=66852 RepID=UPI0026DF3380|nr:radical SAM/SPASM domain protein, ACGX system [Methanobrevibacter sp.]MDO5859182.1 radical SAM/SPASM domain protein, ACGX system [Methanobrevibacter sp.]
MDNFFAFQWHILDNCDQRCKHCYIFSEDRDKELITMDYENMKIVLDNCLEFCKKVNRTPYFSITGGDPILHPNFWQLIERLHEKNIHYSILGNPFHITDKVAERLKSLSCRQYQLSLDGLRETHDYFRKPGSFDITLEKIKTLQDAGLRASIMTTVSKRNIEEIPDLVDVVVENKAGLFSFARYCPTGLQSVQITPREYKNLLDILWAKYQQYKNTDTLFTLKDHLWTLFLYEKELFTIPENLKEEVIYDGCNCGNNHLTILPNGDVFSCRRMDSKVGNALSQSIYDIFIGRDMDEYRKFEKFEKCRKCELLRFCRGCPAVSYGTTNNMYSPDPQCWKEV